ncbi:MAG TPA: DUF1566 domain-containing protein [Roseateles sp.]
MKRLRLGLAALALPAITATLVGIDARMAEPAARFQRLPATPWLVLDRQLGLVWQRCPRGTQLVDDAKQPQCTGKPERFLAQPAEWEAQRLSTPRETWRLPDVRELSSLIDDRRCCHALDPIAFPVFGVPDDGAWGGRTYPFHTATPHSQSDERWRVESLEGEVLPALVRARGLLRLVRTATPQEMAR